MRKVMVLAAALSGVTGSVAMAQEKPLYLPARDVAVTYRLVNEGPGAGPNNGREAHLYYSAALGRLRLDQPSQGGYLVVDLKAKQAVLVMKGMHAWTTVPFDPAMLEGVMLNDRMQFTRTSSDQVAGLPCTGWNVMSRRASGTVCVTTDGVILKGRGKQEGGTISGLDATSVNYATQPPALFQPPPDFRQVTIPNIPPPQ